MLIAPGHIGSFGRKRRVEEAPLPTGPIVTAMVMGQSELEYLFNTGSFYKKLAQPVPGDGNLIVWTQNGAGVAPVRTVVDAASVAAGQVNPAMAALSALLDYVAPGVQFVIGDGAVPGTSRFALADDTTDGTDDRLWSDFSAVADAIETEFGPVGHLIENWYNADASHIPLFKDRFWPFYFGANADGSPFTLGGTVNARQIDHCLYDASADPSVKGRGLFARGETAWDIITPMPFHGAPEDPDPELLNFSENDARLTEPDRAVMIALVDDTLAQSVNVRIGPSAHLCKFGGGSSNIHPDVENADGQILYAWPLAVALLRASGVTIGEPTIVDIEGPTDGSYADLVVDLPNGGDLTTLAALREATYSGSAPHQQDVTGIELTRASGSVRRPVFRTTETGYPSSHRGTVTIVDTGSGNPRRGRIRVTPEEPFLDGDSVSFLRGQATAILVEPRDDNLYPWFPIEHVPALYDASATYPMEGIPVRPYQEELVTLSEETGGGDPSEWLVTDGGYLVDPSNVPAGTTKIEWRFKFRPPVSSVGTTTRILTQESTGCDLVWNATGLGAVVEDSTGATVLALSYFSGAAFAANTRHDVIFSVDQTAEEAVLTIDGTPYTLPFTASGDGFFNTGREVSILATTSGANAVPAGTAFADMEVYFNDVLHKAISNDAATANADPWKQPVGSADFTQGA